MKKSVLFLIFSICLSAACLSVTTKSHYDRPQCGLVDEDIGATKVVKSSISELAIQTYEANDLSVYCYTSISADIAPVTVEANFNSIENTRNTEKPIIAAVPYIKEDIHLLNCSIRHCLWDSPLQYNI